MTTMASTVRWGEDDDDSDRGLWMPMMAACPGYKSQATRKLIKRHLLNAWPLPSYYHFYPETGIKLNMLRMVHKCASTQCFELMTQLCLAEILTADQVKKWWRNEMTFDMSEILKSVRIVNTVEGLQTFTPESGAGKYGVLDVEEASSTLGRCYLFRFSRKFQVNYRVTSILYTHTHAFLLYVATFFARLMT